ncbi:unnamed protein product [Rotaria sordida]|uniref:Uncharacterized protein n=1 Tax=Rotaria sordida TaxID=392033 RepID=A0A814W5J0_9BILA|nr:unnamed protein product [Rotaria sordida]CAF3779117.1 unnamed protein product [Rotaria sordida]
MTSNRKLLRSSYLTENEVNFVFSSFIHSDDLFHIQKSINIINYTNSIQYRLIQNNNSYISVSIDDIIKKINQLLKSISIDEYMGFLFAFIGTINKMNIIRKICVIIKILNY